MAFIDAVTGTDEKFVPEALHALQQLPKLHRPCCIIMGAVHIDRLQKVLIQQGVPFTKVGTKSIKVRLDRNVEVFVQAVNDRFTHSWPMPWLVATDRKAAVGYNNAATMAAVGEILAQDMVIAEMLYVPAGKMMPAHVVAGVHPVASPVTGSKLTLAGHVITVAEDPKVGETMLTCLVYPYKHKHLKHAGTGVYIDGTAPAQEQLSDEMVPPSKLLKWEKQQETLKDAVQARKGAGKWSDHDQK